MRLHVCVVNRMRYGKAHLVYLGGENEQGIQSKQQMAAPFERRCHIFLPNDTPRNQLAPSLRSAPRQQEYLRAVSTKELYVKHQSQVAAALTILIELRVRFPGIIYISPNHYAATCEPTFPRRPEKARQSSQANQL